MNAKIILIRHGQSVWNSDSKNDRFNGHTDIPLTAYGLKQAEKMGIYLKKQNVTAIYCSPLQRAVVTARIIGQNLGLIPQVIEELIEMDFGAWEGLTLPEIENQYRELFLRWLEDPASISPPNGESGYKVLSRIMPIFLTLEERHKGNTIVVVAHKVVNRVALCHWLGLPIASFRKLVPQRVGALNSVSIKSNKAVWIDCIDDTSYMVV